MSWSPRPQNDGKSKSPGKNTVVDLLLSGGETKVDLILLSDNDNSSGE